MAKKTDNKYTSKEYSYIIVNKTKRAGLTILVGAVTVLVGSLIYANLLHDIHWGVFAFPVCALASVVLFSPNSEEWNYRPWQKFPQQVEHHYFD